MRESEIYPWLHEHGFLTPKCRILTLSEIPPIESVPSVLKIDSLHISHKSDVGGIIFPISDHEQFLKARQKILDNLLANHIEFDEENDRFLLSEMIFGIELFAGFVDDPSFGKVIVFGRGGITVELDQDLCFISIDAKRDEIRTAVLSTQISKIFLGYRNLKETLDVVLDWLQHFQQFILSNPTISELDFNPLIFHENRFTIVDARISLTSKVQKTELESADDLPCLFNHQNVAVIGASTNIHKVGYSLAKNILSYSGGNIYLVNPKGGEIDGHSIHKTLDEIDDTIDLALLTIPFDAIIPTIQQLIAKRIKNVIIISAGFKECGAIEAEHTLQTLAKKHSITIIGPNCLGFYHGQSGLNATFATSDIKPGGLALISQSGAVLSCLMDTASEQNIGFSHLLSLGNMANTDFATILPMLENDPTCQTISLYVEGIENGNKLLKALRNVTKPVCICKSAKSTQAQKAAFSHTGNLSGNYKMFRSLMHSIGVKVSDNFKTLLYHRTDPFETVLILTNGGGPGTILTDLVISNHKTLYPLSDEQCLLLDAILPFNWSKNNPVDIIGDADHKRFEKSLEIIENFTDLDLIFLLITPQQMTDPLLIVKALQRTPKIPIVPILLGGKMMHPAEEFLRSKSMLYFKSLEEAVTVLV